MTDSEHRSGHRRRMLKEAKIVTRHGHSTVDCVVRDMSPGGARLKVEDGLSVPASFELLLVSEEARVPAQVVWRKAREIGIRFAPVVASRAA